MLGGGANDNVPRLSPSPDGRRFLGVRRVGGVRTNRDEIVVIENVQEFLRRQGPR
jgi:hypothetical protein